MPFGLTQGSSPYCKQPRAVACRRTRRAGRICGTHARLHSRRPMPLATGGYTRSACVSKTPDEHSGGQKLSVTASVTAAAPFPLSSPLSLEVFVTGTRQKRIFPSMSASFLVFPLAVCCFFHLSKVVVTGLSVCSNLAEDRSCSYDSSNKGL